MHAIDFQFDLASFFPFFFENVNGTYVTVKMMTGCVNKVWVIIISIAHHKTHVKQPNKICSQYQKGLTHGDGTSDNNKRL